MAPLDRSKATYDSSVSVERTIMNVFMYFLIFNYLRGLGANLIGRLLVGGEMNESCFADY